MNKVEETIRKYSNAVSANAAAAIFDIPIDSKVTQAIKKQHQAFINDLDEIQAEQEELQKKADAYDELQKISNQGTPAAKAAEDMKKLGKAFGDAMNRNKRISAIARLLEEFLESDWDFYDISETEQGAMEYAQKIIEFFEKQNKLVEISDAEWDEDDVILIMTEFHNEYLVDDENSVEISIKYAHKIIDLFQAGVVAEIRKQTKPDELPQQVVDWIRHTKALCWNVTDVLAPEASNYRQAKYVRKWLEEDIKRYDTLALAFLTGNYTMKQEQLYHVKFPNLGYLIKARDTEHCFLNNAKLHDDRLQSNFTESEIKEIDERYWAFAVKVEEEQG